METKYIINPNKLLPKSVAIVAADRHLYRIGLSLYKTDDNKRNEFHNPLFIFILITQLLVRFVIYIMLAPEDDPKFHIIIGNFTHLMGNTSIVCLGCITISLIAWCSLILNFYNYKYGIEPNYMNVFRMIAGSKTPKSIGITDDKLCHKLMIVSKYTFKLGTIVENSQFLLNFLLLFVFHIPYITKNPILLFISIVNTFLVALTSHYMYAIIVWQFVYYYIIIYYLRLKIMALNEYLKQCINNRNIFRKYSNIISIIKSFNQIYLEINEYNSNYWTIFLSIIWINISVILVSINFVLIISNNAFIFKLFLIPFELLFLLLILFIIHISSQISFQSNNSYQLFNTLFCLIRRKNIIKFKVIFFIYFICLYSLNDNYFI